jgi:hypothetical protein
LVVDVGGGSVIEQYTLRLAAQHPCSRRIPGTQGLPSIGSSSGSGSSIGSSSSSTDFGHYGGISY